MSKGKSFERSVFNHLGRIEHKCDLIVSELIYKAGTRSENRRLDCLIDRLHKSARRMRSQCFREFRNHRINHGHDS